jgi:hypothetical protein
VVDVVIVVTYVVLVRVGVEVHVHVQTDHGAVRCLRVAVTVVERTPREGKFCVVASLDKARLLLKHNVWRMTACGQGGTVGAGSDVDVVRHLEAALVQDRVQMQVEHVDTYRVGVAYPHIPAPPNVVVAVSSSVSRLWISDLATHVRWQLNVISVELATLRVDVSNCPLSEV